MLNLLFFNVILLFKWRIELVLNPLLPFVVDFLFTLFFIKCEDLLFDPLPPSLFVMLILYTKYKSEDRSILFKSDKLYNEIKLFIAKMEEFTGNKVTVENLKKAIDLCNRKRQALKRLYD